MKERGLYSTEGSIQQCMAITEKRGQIMRKRDTYNKKTTVL